MPPRRVKSGTAPGTAAVGGNRTWESGLAAAQLEEDSWKADISLVVGARIEDADYVKALVLAVQLPVRRSFTVITWDATLEKIHELGNPKAKKPKDAPMFSEVMESAKAVLDAGEELPAHLLGKVLKFQLLAAKATDLQRRAMEQRAPEEKAKGKARAGSPSKEKGGAAAKAAGKAEKGKKAPEPPAPVKETKLKRRGEGEEPSTSIDDEPVDGPQLYVLLVGFLQPQLVAVLDMLGVFVSNIIRVSSARRSGLGGAPRDPESSSGTDGPQNEPVPQDLEQVAEGDSVRVQAQLAWFWKYLDPVLSSGPPGSRLWDVSQLHYTVSEERPVPDSDNIQATLLFGMCVFEGVARLIYDCLDWRRQHLHYLSSLRLMQVPAVAGGNAPNRQESPGQASVKADPQTPVSKRKPIPDESAAVAPPVVTMECDMQYYRDLLDLLPPETVSVPLILYCLREQVVATEEQIPPPSAERLKPRAHGLDPTLADHMIAAALSLDLSEEEKQKLLADFGVEEHSQEEKELQRPLLFNCHDERSKRLQQLSVHCGLDAVQVEVEMLRSSPLWRSLGCAQTQSETRQRLARAQELLHFCTDESLSWAEVEWAFRQFVFESMYLIQEEGRDPGMGEGPQAPPIIPWDDPVSFMQQIRLRAAPSTEQHANQGVDSRNDRPGSELSKEGCSEKLASGVGAADIRGSRVRSLRNWHYAEHHQPSVFPQVLQEAYESCSSIDMLHGAQDKAVFLVFHNPRSPQRQSKELWDMALHTDVGFRKYLRYVADSISDWTNQEEERRLAQQEEREAERLNAPTPSEQSPISKKRSRGSPKRAISGRATSPVKSPCPEEPALELHIRQDSLKAWKMEQDRQREEELAKKSKKEKERKGGSKGGDRSPSSRSSKKTLSGSRKKKEEATKRPDSAAPPEDGRTEVQLPAEEERGFLGYCMAGDLIQVWGCRQSLFPSDGGLIRVENTQFIHGSTMVKVCVTKDKHHFFTHITDPRREGEGKDDDITAVVGGVEHKRRPVSKFGSFSAQLDNGIRLSYSHHGPSGETAEEKDPALSSVLDVRPPPTPSPVPSSAPSRSPSGKRRKSHSSKGAHAKGSSPPAVPAEREGSREGETQGTPNCTQEGKEKPVRPESSGTSPAPPPVPSLSTCTPHGLLVQFLSAPSPGAEGEAPGVMVRQSFPALGQSSAGGRGLPLSLESSRLITSQGMVIKHLRDGSTQVLFADGTVSYSPASGPVCTPPPDPPAPEQEVKAQRLEIKEPAEKRGKQGSRASMVTPATVKKEGVELSDQRGGAERDGPEQGGAAQPCDRAWVTTTPSGLRVATTGSKAIPTPPLLAGKATDPMTGTVMITREDRVLMVLEESGTFTAEHADGTRITTFYQEAERPLSADHQDTAGQEAVTVTRKLARVECEGFVTVVMSCEDGTCSAEFGEETVIAAHPSGAYQVFPSAGGLLCIDEDGTATYTSHPGHNSVQTPAGQKAELQSGFYTMRHTTNVICEVIDPEGNLFQVMVDGETSAVISSPEDCFEEEMDEDEEEGDSERTKLFPCVSYKEPSPRFFVVHEDGSGTELLHSSEMEDFLCSAHSDPRVAVLKEPIPELQGVWGITVLRPCSKDIWSHWLTPKPSEDIIPTNLRSRRWDTFPAVERKTPGPPFGSTLGRGLHLKDRPTPRPPTPVLTCPEVLEVRQLIQYQPISSQLRRTLESRLQRYLQHLLERELLWEEVQLKEPRTEEEKVHATDLLQLVLSLPDSESPADSMQKRLSALDLAFLYSQSISTVLTDCVTHLAPEEEFTHSCNEEQQESLWASRIEQYRRELQEAEECRLALRNRLIPPYFSSDICMAFTLTQEVPDMDSLSLELPPFPRQRENPEIQEFHSDAPQPACKRPTNPTPSHAAGGVAPSQRRSTDPAPQALAPPCPPPTSGNGLHPQTRLDQSPIPPGPQDLFPDHSPPGYMSVPLCGSSSQRGRHSECSESGRRTWELDVAGNPRRERVKLPSAILCAKPNSRPNRRFLSVEEPVRRKVRTVSVCRSQSNGVLPTPPRGFQLLPAEVDFGVLREGYTYSVTVAMKNVGVDSCRFNIKQPPPATGLKVLYTPGPVAAGMKADLQVELFAMATGLQDSQGEGAVSYYIQIQTETEILYLPVSATVLPGDLYDSRVPVGGTKVQVGGAKVRLVSTTPSVQQGVVRPHRQPNPTDE